jgi:hypothetical protein
MYGINKMPSARYFRLVPYTSKKKIDISAIHLYDGNIRVDQTATITTGTKATNTNVIKIDNPVVDSLVSFDKTTQRETACSVYWQFSSAVNVNAFRIGSGDSENTFLDQFVIYYSDDGITYIRFIAITADVKLDYPGPWQLSQLKPVGEGFPMYISSASIWRGTTNGGGHYDIENGRTFVGNKAYRNKGLFSFNYINGNTDLQIVLPGHYRTGKFYFEINANDFNMFGVTSSSGEASNFFKISLFMAPDSTERTYDFISTSLRAAAFSLNYYNFYDGVNPYNANYYKRWNASLLVTRFVPGTQCGVVVDFDNRKIQYLNPSWTVIAPGLYDPSNPFMNNVSNTETSWKLAIVSGASNGYSRTASHTFSLNFGQEPFTHTVPAGVYPCFGPRWKEVYTPFTNTEARFVFKDDTVGFDNTFEVNNNVHYASKARSRTPIEHSGFYYIKGTISRDPDLATKKMVARLYSHSSQSFVDTTSVSGNGEYEFYGIKYGLYSVYSSDFSNNSSTEVIGPMYPLKIV